jgi:hypothetical protein
MPGVLGRVLHHQSAVMRQPPPLMLRVLSAEVGLVNATTIEVGFYATVTVTAAGDDYVTGATLKKGTSTITLTGGTRQTDQTKVRFTVAAGDAFAYGDVVTIQFDATSKIVDALGHAVSHATIGVENNVDSRLLLENGAALLQEDGAFLEVEH